MKGGEKVTAAQILLNRAITSQTSGKSSEKTSNTESSVDFMSLMMSIVTGSSEVEAQQAGEGIGSFIGGGLQGEAASDANSGDGEFKDSLSDISAIAGSIALAMPQHTAPQFIDMQYSKLSGESEAQDSDASSVAVSAAGIGIGAAGFTAGAIQLTAEQTAVDDAGINAPDETANKGIDIADLGENAAESFADIIGDADAAAAGRNNTGQDNMLAGAEQGRSPIAAAATYAQRRAQGNQSEHMTVSRIRLTAQRTDMSRTNFQDMASTERAEDESTAGTIGIAAAQVRTARAEGRSERQTETRNAVDAMKVGQAQLYGGARIETQGVRLGEVGMKETEGVEGAAGSDIEVASQLADAIRGRAQGGDESEFRLRLKPEGLGEVMVRLRKTSDRIDVELVAELKSTRELISRDLDALRVALAADADKTQYRFATITVEGGQTQSLSTNLTGSNTGRGGGDAEPRQSDSGYRTAARSEEKSAPTESRRFYGNRIIDYIA